MPVTRVRDLVEPVEEERGSATKLAAAGKKRTRTGCLNCRKKRRKCDETKPRCQGCQNRRETCEWGVRLSFRPENAQSMDIEHPSMRQAAEVNGKTQNFQIIDITPEVIRDYFEEITPPPEEGSEPLDSMPKPSSTAQVNSNMQSPIPAVEPLDHGPSPHLNQEPIASPVIDTALFATDDFTFLSPNLSDSVLEDGIFLPGSHFQELHTQLRSRIFDTARSAFPSRFGTPEIFPEPASELPLEDDEESRRLAHLSPEQEYRLWDNYINEVASWVDKFDSERHWELVLPLLAKSHPHLKYAILALSARQIERKEKKLDFSCSLALYQHAIHLLSPLLHLRTTEILASCMVLCVLEMLSCSPKAWRRHLDGCAALIQALNISGTCGGLEQALFWGFARMDICGALISSETTLIPMHNWIGAADVMTDVSLLIGQGRSDIYANLVIYLCGRVVELFCSSGKWEQKNGRCKGFPSPSFAVDYTSEWQRLFELVESWYNNRPEAMKALITIPSSTGQNSSGKPFPTIFFGNPAAVSGNQMYHTAALLMLKYKPAHVQFARKPHSMLWHARHICAISISNAHHGCWTNSTQPLWIAGQHMSHPCEHKAILEIYERIERETGWATKWRADDLRDFWGDLEE
ncbi:hypothetical protein KC351_g16802 [Hortaea werneckii]|nr:hypothetical protein KC351_g16802 [Hortaea werneckii]